LGRLAAWINQLKGEVTMMFITHAMPKNLLVADIVRIASVALSAVGGARDKNTGFESDNAA
jgi:hypothetical protein